ncbi:MAG: hypothetical protein ACK58N_02610 [Synechocystis sp.]|jgi:hypothetical protein
MKASWQAILEVCLPIIDDEDALCRHDPSATPAPAVSGQAN